uniref:Ig-like domain-containing protein n=1 Tax=Gongylonema pulchrum TaxID=637853 RepID=A0A183DML6_9BILA
LKEHPRRQLVLFTFTVVYSDKSEQFAYTSAHFHVIKLQPHETVTIKCHASLLGLGEAMDVEWWREDAVVPTANSTLSVLHDQDLGLYRCLADVAIVSVDLLDSYLVNSRVKRSGEMPSGKVLSSGIIVERMVPRHFIVHPKK